MELAQAKYIINIRINSGRRLKRAKPETSDVPAKINDTRSMDFMSDSLADGRTIRTFNIIDDYKFEWLCIGIDLSMPSSRVIFSIEQVIEWVRINEINLIYIQPSKSTQHAYVERYNRTVRNKWLDLNVFESIDHAQTLAAEWLLLYNNERPHMGLNCLIHTIF